MKYPAGQRRGARTLRRNIPKGSRRRHEDISFEKTISYFQQQPKPLSLYPCHCTDFTARAELNSKLPIQEVGVGLQLIW